MILKDIKLQIILVIKVKYLFVGDFMETINLVIKYKEKYICMMNKNEIDFIHVPHYTEEEAFSNISIFCIISFIFCILLYDFYI